MLFLDMDGVLADFDQHHENLFGSRPLYDGVFRKADWDNIENAYRFYANIPPMKDLPELWLRTSRYNPTILTGCPAGDFGKAVEMQKRDWVARVLGRNVPVVTCRSAEKSLYCCPGDVLVDDWEKYRSLWEARGGVWITHTSAEQTGTALNMLGL
jgi:hypothetical protein